MICSSKTHIEVTLTKKSPNNIVSVIGHSDQSEALAAWFVRVLARCKMCSEQRPKLFKNLHWKFTLENPQRRGNNVFCYCLKCSVWTVEWLLIHLFLIGYRWNGHSSQIPKLVHNQNHLSQSRQKMAIKGNFPGV